MTRHVLDASALLALLLNEVGATKVREILDSASMSAVNLAEVVSHFAKLGARRGEVEAMLKPLPVRVLPVDTDLSYGAGMLRAATASKGLSLGDRYCLALAKRDEAIAVTADRPWTTIAETVGVTIHVIR